MLDDTEYGVSFVSLPGMAAIEVVDPIERHRYRLETPDEVEPTTIDTDGFHFPVDRAVRVTTSGFSLPGVVPVYVRTQNGALVAEAEHQAEVSLDAETYVVELCSPVKLYLEFQGPVTILSTQSTMDVVFDDDTQVDVGARSAHRKPEATVTTTTDPTDLMQAVSTFGSALKTLSPERSFPTLRGHPPRIRIGEELDVPAPLAPPDTGITLSLEPTVEAVFSSTTLAYYLGAKMHPGDGNELRIDGECLVDLGPTSELDAQAASLLKHLFLLDCVVRTEGLYPVNLHERQQVEQHVSIDPAGLYNASVAERTARYLEIPVNALEDIQPTWGIAAHMVPDPKHAELLSYVADDLAEIRVHDPTSLEQPESPTDIVGTSVQNEATAFTRSTGATSAASAEFVNPPAADSIEEVWIGDGMPIGSSKAIPSAFNHRLERSPTTGDIDIVVVCNDHRMNDERGVIDDIYGSRTDITSNLTIHQHLTRSELSEVLATGGDFLHFIGHIDVDGIECSDGKLDIADLSEINVPAFLLNACQSYQQGVRLIERGGIGGIVTLSDVINEGAVSIGCTLAQLLNMGFPLYAALRIARQDSFVGARYIVVGDGRFTVAQPQSVPKLAEVEDSNRGLSLGLRTFPTSRRGSGTMVVPHLSTNDKYYLIGNDIEFDSISADELTDFLQIENMPVRHGQDLTWGQSFEIE